VIARVAVLAFALTACGGASEPGNDEEPSPTCNAPHAGTYEAPVYPGALIDAWGVPADPRVVVSFVPQTAEYCD
jgi:hypothetical protein